jgi:hypothetical protein
MKENKQLRSIRRLLLLFILSLLVSGLTVFPMQWELEVLRRLFPDGGIGYWLKKVEQGYTETARQHPFLFYGYDWLGFAHIVLALLFIGPYRDPIRNRWVIEFGLLACLLILPFAFICGTIRGIPALWQLIDCSFGIVGGAVLLPCYYRLRQLEEKRAAWLLQHSSATC